MLTSSKNFSAIFRPFLVIGAIFLCLAILEQDAAAEDTSPGKGETETSEAPKSSTASATTPEPPPTFKISGTGSRAFQKYTGLTWLTERSINLTGTLAAKLVLHGHPHLNVQAYSLTDSLKGKFKKVSVDLKDCSYKNIPLGEVHATTLMPVQFRLFKSKKGKPGVAAPVMVAVNGQVKEDDVSRALESPTISSSLNFLRLTLPGLGDQHLQVIEPKVKLENGVVKINTWLITANAPKETGVKLDISANPVLEKERFIMLKDTKVDSADIIEPEKFSAFSEDLLNPLLDFGRYDRHTHAFRLNELNVEEKKVRFAGKLLLAPKPVAPSN